MPPPHRPPMMPFASVEPQPDTPSARANPVAPLLGDSSPEEYVEAYVKLQTLNDHMRHVWPGWPGLPHS